MDKIETYTKKQAEQLVKQLNKREPYTDKKGNTHIEMAFPFQVSRGKWLVLKDHSITSAETMETTFRINYLGHTVAGESQEDCLLKIIACLTADLINKGMKL